MVRQSGRIVHMPRIPERGDDIAKEMDEIVNGPSPSPAGDISKRVVERYAKGSAAQEPVEFSDEVVQVAYERSKDRCECDRADCDEGHSGRCKTTFKFSDRGHEEDDWNAHHWRARKKGGTGSVENCEIVCVPCHKSTDSYGKG